MWSAGSRTEMGHEGLMVEAEKMSQAGETAWQRLGVENWLRLAPLLFSLLFGRSKNMGFGVGHT